MQIESVKISKADRMKKLHFENKYLYGSSIKVKDEQQVAALTSDDVKNDKDISSEIYWTCLHVPEVQDFTKPKKKEKIKSKAKTPKKLNFEEPFESNEPKIAKVKKPKKKTAAKEVPVLNEDIDPVMKNSFSEDVEQQDKKTSPKKTAKKINIIPDLPYTLTQLSSALPSSKSISKNTKKKKPSDSDSDEDSEERDIPFESSQLRAIPNFPLILQNNKIISTFENFVDNKPSMNLPSVSKVLQGTMPDSQRAALMQWKSVQITELGLEGFELMQKCE